MRDKFFFKNLPNSHFTQRVRNRLVKSYRRGPRHLALIGNHLPRRCGIATFTADTREALIEGYPDMQVDTYVMDDRGNLQYPDAITGIIRQNIREEYRECAATINASGADLVWLQHEFGIFGGTDGNFILELLDHLEVPLAVTLHTVLENPSPGQKVVMQALLKKASCVIVMAQKAREILLRCYHVGDARIEVILHGIPDVTYVEPNTMKSKFGLEGKKVALTFGLLSHDKGIGSMIDAMAEVVQRVPEAVYIILGATHPHLLATEGEALRDGLMKKAEKLGIAEHIRWVNSFVDVDLLTQYLQAADVYVTPYLNPLQITSGTLSYAVGLGKPVISTPYIHAKELLDDGTGIIVPIGDCKKMADAVGDLLTHDTYRALLAERAYLVGRTMTWDCYARNAVALFDEVLSEIANPSLPVELSIAS